MPDLALSPTQRATEPNAATDAMRLAPGTMVGEYVVERFLGAGAMGEVYAGKHPVIGKAVAIKILRPALADSTEAVQRFKREARVVNQIGHPNVIDVFAFGELGDGRWYLVMDLVDGKTLRAACAEGPMPVETVLDILDQIADALDAAHAKGVVHRDLKPDNVMLSATQPPKISVLDFGIAKHQAAGEKIDPQTLLTAKGAWIGTPGYMAPEQWSADGATAASDRYALGVMAFELLSGKLPFEAGTLPQMMEQHFRAPVPALSTRGAIAARGVFDPVLSRAMAKDPDKRYPTAKALVTALREASGKKLRRVVGPPKRLWVPAAIGTGVLGVAVAGVIVARGGGKRERGSAPSGTELVTLDVRTNPPRAMVFRGDRSYGAAPVTLELKPNEQVELTVKKPGYNPETRSVVASEPRTLELVLVQINNFEGTWQFPDGQLRTFRRADDEHVSVFKRTSLGDEEVFFRKYLLEDAPAGIKFSSTETVIDPRGAADASCHVPVRVEYSYDPVQDALEVRPEDVETDFKDGRCIVVSRELARPVLLARADRSGDTRRTTAPMGGPPVDQPRLRSTRDATGDRKTEEAQKATGDRKTEEAQKKRPPRARTIEPDIGNVDAPKDKATPIENAPPPPRKGKVPPQKNAPPQTNQAITDTPAQAKQPDLPRGDSQIAPQVKN